MLALKKLQIRPTALLHGPQPSAEDLLHGEVLFKPLIFAQEHPDLALECYGGVKMTAPTQRLMLYAAHRGAAENLNVSSRGTSKSATWCVLYGSYHATFFNGRKIVELAATGFRGGQLMFEDMEKFLNGGWDSQDPKASEFMRRSISQTTNSKSLVHRAPNFWRVKFASYSEMSTYPTNDEDKIRGIRGHLLFVDEANFADPNMVNTVAKSFLNVLTDFEFGGANSKANGVFYCTTIDYAWRDFQSRVTAARTGLKRDYDAWKAKQRGDLATYRQLEQQGLHEYTYTSFDYTDVLIRRYLTNREGKRFRVHFPNKQLEVMYDPKGIPFSIRRPDGQMQREGVPLEFYRVYPINKSDIERDLLDGSTEETVWMSEQRNVVDTATGDVYPHWLLNKVSGPILKYEDCPEHYRKIYADTEADYLPPVLWKCHDPCVLGVDVATGDRDFATFVVARIGPMASGEFDPVTHHGHTQWSNVIWVEQYRQMSHKQIAEKIQALRERYNIVYHFDPVEKDDWKMCRGIGMDMGGGGSGVRDALVFIDQEEPPPGMHRIYDPLDDDSRIQAFAQDKAALPMLDTIRPSDVLNERCVEFTLAQMKVGRLYLPPYIDPSQRLSDPALNPGYSGAKMLLHQLRKIQQEPTKSARRFFMPGDEERVESKKDLFSGFLYCGKQLRAHLIRHEMIITTPPPMGARLTQIGSKRGQHGRAPGSRR